MPTITTPQYLLDQAKRRVTTSPMLTLPGMGQLEKRLMPATGPSTRWHSPRPAAI